MTTRVERQRATRDMTQCACGNIARRGTDMCGACEHQDDRMQELMRCEDIHDIKAFIAAHLMEGL